MGAVLAGSLRGAANVANACSRPFSRVPAPGTGSEVKDGDTAAQALGAFGADAAADWSYMDAKSDPCSLLRY